MTVYTGGMRDRLIHDSLFRYVQDGLTSLGWFNTSHTGYVYPVTLIPEQVPWDEPLQMNTITVAPGVVTGKDYELGNASMENEKSYYIDVYGENEALSIHLSGDIKDLLRGKLTTVPSAHSRTGFFSQPTLDVYDWTQATPSWIFFCDIDNVQVDRTQNFPHLWQRYLYTVSLTLCDYYATDQDLFAYGSQG